MTPVRSTEGAHLLDYLRVLLKRLWLVVGVFISATLGIGLGLWIGLSPKFDWLVSPIFVVMQAAPLAALIPLLVMAYGIGLTSKVFVVCIMAMPVMSSTAPSRLSVLVSLTSLRAVPSIEIAPSTLLSAAFLVFCQREVSLGIFSTTSSPPGTDAMNP